jgi:hypothetical protein
MRIVTFVHASRRYRLPFEIVDGQNFADLIGVVQAARPDDWHKFELYDGFDSEWVGEWYRERQKRPIPFHVAPEKPAQYEPPPAPLTYPRVRDFHAERLGRRPRRGFRKGLAAMDPWRWLEPDIPHNWGNDAGDLLDHLDFETRGLVREAIASADLYAELEYYG